MRPGIHMSETKDCYSGTGKCQFCTRRGELVLNDDFICYPCLFAWTAGHEAGIKDMMKKRGGANERRTGI